MDLVIHDEYVENKKKYICSQMLDMRNAVDRFRKIIKNLCVSGVELGKTAEALKAFATYLDNLYTTGDFDNIAKQIEVFSNSYLEEIDTIDSDLY